MEFSNTTTKAGLIQTIEFWTNLGDGAISGNATLLKVMTGRVNSAFDRLMPYLYSFSEYLSWDDANQTDLPIATVNLVSGQADYKIAQDDNSLDILNITNVQVLPSATATLYGDVEKLTIDDPRALSAMSPASTDTGTPYGVLVRGNTLFFTPTPNYSATNGIKIFFEREASYFASTDTSKEPGIPQPYQELLALYASYDWLVVNKPDNGTLITRLEAQIAKREKQLENANRTRYPRHARLTMAGVDPY